MFETFIHLLFIGASALSAGLLVYVLVGTVTQTIGWFYLRRKPWWARLAQQSRATLKPLTPQSNQLSRLVLLSMAGGLAVKAALTGGVLIAAYLLLVGIALYVYLGRRSSSLSRERVTSGMGELVAAYYSAYLVVPTVFSALSEAITTISSIPLRTAVQRAIDAFGLGKRTEEALDQLVNEVRDPYLAQFVFILRHTSESNRKEISGALQSLGKRLEQRKRLQDRSRVALALVNGTVRFLQAANGALVALVVLVPFWWNFYATSISHQALFMIFVTVTLVGSWYFENEVSQARERVL